MVKLGSRWDISHCQFFLADCENPQLNMLTKYFSKATVKFTAVGKSSKLARVFMASIPPTARNTIQVSHTVLPEGSPVKPVISVTFSKLFVSLWRLYPQSSTGLY